MKEIINTIKLDFITVKGKSFIPLIFCMLIMFTTSLFTLAHLITMMAVFAGFAVQPVFAVAEQSGYNKLYGILPIRKHNIVFGRFAFGLVLILAVTLISIPLGYIANTVPLGGNIDSLKDFIYVSNEWQTGGFTIELMASFCFFFGCCFAAATYTLLFIFGVSKEIPATFGFLIVSGVLVFLLNKVFKFDFGVFMQSMGTAIANHSILTMIALYLGGTAIMLFGASISNFFFCNREL